MKEIVSIILAAGKGTRMKSKRAKVLHPLLGRPLVSYPVGASRRVGAVKSVLVVGHQGEQVRELLGDAPDLAFAVQENQRGTADAVASAKPALEEFEGTALILCGDVPLLRAETMDKLLEAHEGGGNLVTVLSMECADPTGYGRLVRDPKGALTAIVEERDASEEVRAITEVNSGTYAVELPWLWGALDQIGSSNDQGEFYLTDIVAIASKEDGAGSLVAEDADETMGINSRGQLAEAATLLRARINDEWMEAGVTLEDPATTWIEPGVTLGEEVTIGPGSRLRGATSVGAGTLIEQGAAISDSRIGCDVHIKPYCVITQAQVGDQAQVGPFAHLRPKAILEEASRVGNFVELKNTRLGKGAKANHLAYLGDTEIGEKANIGAGTITCNYDGVNKFRTVIGARAFIGSNSSLVAPVEVGDDSVVAAGSTITKGVEPSALGLGRAKQKNISGWKARQASVGKKKD
jgi:bifunctional UDP-N-acetylglucosamine pyrophosphorylase/glucosamine-1-phosphate N-acetyltransferase